ncbi:MAG: hypothetical protein LBI53_08390 [Candidatus Peribacteria bacterium]|nr:hypothetical protein [Candidatus Peribacteria bacterium]
MTVLPLGEKSLGEAGTVQNFILKIGHNPRSLVGSNRGDDFSQHKHLALQAIMLSNGNSLQEERHT